MAVSDDKTMFSLSMPKELKQRAERVAALEARSLANLVCIALRKYVEEYENTEKR